MLKASVILNPSAGSVQELDNLVKQIEQLPGAEVQMTTKAGSAARVGARGVAQWKQNDRGGGRRRHAKAKIWTKAPDSDGLLEGSGKQHRYVAFAKPEDFEKKGLNELLRTAVTAWQERSKQNA